MSQQSKQYIHISDHPSTLTLVFLSSVFTPTGLPIVPSSVHNLNVQLFFFVQSVDGKGPVPQDLISALCR